MRRGDVYDARLDPTEGSEQAGIRPVVVVSRDAINSNLSTVVIVPCTTYRSSRRLYPSQVLISAPDGGLTVDSVALCEQVRTIGKGRLLRLRGALSQRSLVLIGRALSITLEL
jgi:mRNA interferase MazF